MALAENDLVLKLLKVRTADQWMAGLLKLMPGRHVQMVVETNRYGRVVIMTGDLA